MLRRHRMGHQLVEVLYKLVIPLNESIGHPRDTMNTPNRQPAWFENHSGQYDYERGLYHDSMVEGSGNGHYVDMEPPSHHNRIPATTFGQPTDDEDSPQPAWMVNLFINTCTFEHVLFFSRTSLSTPVMDTILSRVLAIGRLCTRLWAVRIIRSVIRRGTWVQVAQTLLRFLHQVCITNESNTFTQDPWADAEGSAYDYSDEYYNSWYDDYKSVDTMTTSAYVTQQPNYPDGSVVVEPAPLWPETAETTQQPSGIRRSKCVLLTFFCSSSRANDRLAQPRPRRHCRRADSSATD